MEKYKVIRYQSENYAQWNAFVARAKNATFLFHRDFMSYHQDRFEDYSLLVLDAKIRLRQFCQLTERRMLCILIMGYRMEA